jgi:pyruvate,orthophosphate dikinase
MAKSRPGRGARKAERITWPFGPRGAAGHKGMKEILGGKGANLAEMCRLGLPVPPGFTIGTPVCRRYYEIGGRLPPEVGPAVREAMARLERETGKRFGDGANPLLVSVRSGAAASMPGMMDTVLNLGLTAAATEGLARLTGNRRFALDARRRLIQMFGNVVEGTPPGTFERILAGARDRAGVAADTDLAEKDIERVVEDYLKAFTAAVGRPFPEDPYEMLERAIDAVFASWEGARAVEYRRIHKIQGLLGTAVNVQAMVFGNMGADSGTGVCFTRDPSTGADTFYGDLLMNAQGEDVVAGIRTPLHLAALKRSHPKIYAQLERIRRRLERHYRNIQDIEFTIERGRLFVLQTRNGKTTAAAAVRIAVDLAREGLITRETALSRIAPEQIDLILHPRFDPKAERPVLTVGTPASPGAVHGKVVFDAEAAKRLATAGEAAILVRNETSPEDVGGMHAARGILTATGGRTSHAAVVARGMNRCCVVGAGEVRIDEEQRLFRVSGRVVREGEVISLDGTTGEVMRGAIPTIQPEPGPSFHTLLKWADEARRLAVRANADTPEDARVARGYGAEGVGLCRTEHMFFGDERIAPMREMILAEGETERRRALEKLLPFQRRDFQGILERMDGLPVTIRLLDPPLHEFLPHEEAQAAAVAAGLGVPVATVLDRARRLHEANPMLGHRGCRLGITYPEIYEMQVRAIYEAAATLRAAGKDPRPEVMIPLVGIPGEFTTLKDRLSAVATETLARTRSRLKVIFGTMIEVPRAALVADKIAESAEFFSFGTNDLTQMTFGFSRDDVGSFLPAYVSRHLLEDEPFQVLDREGVGQLVRMAVERGRGARPGLKVGICGEHGGEPKSIAFCHEVGLDYVSCSPYRVPVARLAAAHAAIADATATRRVRPTARRRRTARRPALVAR